MKKSIILLLLSGLAIPGHSQSKEETQRIATFCKVWGFLKYYHPAVAKGKLDWDKEFTSRVRTVSFLPSREVASNYYITWLNSLGRIKPCKKCGKSVPDSLKRNLDLTWLSDTNLFTPTLVSQLEYIQQNRNQGKNHYVKQSFLIGNVIPENEKPYKDSVFPTMELRLLGLARYWNMIGYFYPYKYRIDGNWNKVLTEMVPKFAQPADTIAYHLAMLELTTKINDSHARLSTPYTQRYFGKKWPPFKFKIIDQKAIVTGFYNDTLCRRNDIRIGDVFYKINGRDISDLINSKTKYVGASNEPGRLRNFYNILFNGASDSVATEFERNGHITQKTIYRYDFKALHFTWSYNPQAGLYKLLDNDIGYVNMELLEPKQVDEVLEKLKDAKAIIFDVRNYPNGTMYKIARFLNPEKRSFVTFTYPDLSYPGTFKYSHTISCGSKNKNAYKGKVILLCNEDTQSHAEFTLMALKTAPHATIIGSQTAGADGDVSLITFPGDYKTYITGLGVYYPNGGETQRIGIVPDIEVKPTIAGIKARKDEVLEKALEFLNSH